MKLDEFIAIASKIKRFKLRLEQEGIIGNEQQTILKIYIQDLTSRINTNMLKVV